MTSIGCAGLFLTVLALVGRWAALLPWGFVVVGAGYALFLSLRGATVDARAPILAATFFVAAELSRRGLVCPVCRSDVDSSYLVCPICTTKLRQACVKCRAPLEALWQVCPYCETPIEATGQASIVPRRGS